MPAFAIPRLLRAARALRALRLLEWLGRSTEPAITSRCLGDAEASLVSAPLFFGGSMQVDVREIVSQTLFMSGAFECELSRFLFDYLSPGMGFVDVGAHFGYFSLLASDRVGETGRVLALEPTPSTYAALLENTRRSSAIETLPVAAWSATADLTLEDFGPHWSAFNSVAGARFRFERPPIAARVEVRGRPLDEILSERALVPDVVKIDVESAELHVLQGMRETLRDMRPIVSVEVGDLVQLVEAGVAPSSSVLRYLIDHGYSTYEPSLTKGLFPHSVRDGRYRYGNIVAVPIEKATSVESLLARVD